MKDPVPYYKRAYVPTGNPQVYRGVFWFGRTAIAYAEQLRRFGFKNIAIETNDDGSFRIARAER